MKNTILLIIVLVGILYALPGEWTIHDIAGDRKTTVKYHPLNKNEIWVSYNDVGVCVYKDNKPLFNIAIKDGLPSLNVRDIEFDSQGNCWIATDKGLARWNTNGTLDKFPVGAGYLPHYIIHSLKFDSTRNRMLIGTDKGLAIFKGDFTRSPYVPNTADWENHLDHIYVMNLVVSGHRIALIYGGICFIQNSTGSGWTSYENLGEVWGLAVDKSGVIWATYNNGVAKFNNGQWETVVAGPKGANTVVDRNNVLWVIGNSVIVTIDINNGNMVTNFSKSEHDWLTLGRTEALNLNHIGNVLIGCEKVVAENTAGSPIKFFSKPVTTRLPITISANNLVVNQAGSFRVDLVSARGQVIKIADGFYPAGVKIPFFSVVSSGNYLLHIRTSKGELYGKVVITK